MAIVWRKAPGVFLNSLYDTLKILETPNPADRLHLQSSKLNTPTIGIGFDLKAGGDTVQKAVLTQMGFKIEAWLLDPTGNQRYRSRNLSEQIEVGGETCRCPALHRAARNQPRAVFLCRGGLSLLPPLATEIGGRLAYQGARDKVVRWRAQGLSVQRVGR